MRVYIYSPDRQKIQVHDTRHVISRMSHITTQSDDYSSQASSNSGLDIYGIQPVDIKWDERDSNLISVLYKGNESSVDDVIICYWVTENGLLEQEEIQFPSEARSFLSLRAPFFIFSTNDSSMTHHKIKKVPLRDFVGLESCDDSTRSALLDFSRQVSHFRLYESSVMTHLMSHNQMAIGDLDAAFNSIKLIKNERVWLNLAKRCVYTKRLDVARVCLANMGNARAAAALRKAEKEPEVEAHIAMLALQLGLIPEAEKLYKQAKRFDLLNKFYQVMSHYESYSS